MISGNLLRSMSSRPLRTAANRTKAISHQLMSTSSVASSSAPPEPTVIFESQGAVRRYTLNRPSKLNALDGQMLSVLRPKIEEWRGSDLCGVIVGTGVGRAFCSGGDVTSVMQDVSSGSNRRRRNAIEYFKSEFELDYILATLKKPYMVILDGMTMGGGMGLASYSTFRIATEQTVIAMPETKIGYCPDVGGSHFLSRLDGEIGTYLALTSETLTGRAVFEHGLATHYLPSKRLPLLLHRLAELNNLHASKINNILEEFSAEQESDRLSSSLTDSRRIALDYAFRHDKVEDILKDLEKLAEHKDASIKQWATDTLNILLLRSPTSLKVALKAIRLGKTMDLLPVLNMELKIATAFCCDASPDFVTGVRAVLGSQKERIKGRPLWSPASVPEVSDAIVSRFFEPTSPFLSAAPQLNVPEHPQSGTQNYMKYALPSESEIRDAISAGGRKRIDDLLSILRPGKRGVKEKILEIAKRCCDTEGDGSNMENMRLSWKESPPAEL